MKVAEVRRKAGREGWCGSLETATITLLYGAMEVTEGGREREWVGRR